MGQLKSGIYGSAPWVCESESLEFLAARRQRIDERYGANEGIQRGDYGPSPCCMPTTVLCVHAGCSGAPSKLKSSTVDNTSSLNIPTLFSLIHFNFLEDQQRLGRTNIYSHPPASSGLFTYCHGVTASLILLFYLLSAHVN